MRRSRQGGDEGETSPLHLNFYDAQGRKDSLWVVGDARMSLRDPSGQSHEILDSVLYLRGGMIDSVGYGNGVGQKYGYDSTRQLLRSMVSTRSGNTLHRLEMTYDDEGNVQTQTRPNGEKALFEYDGLYRLKLVRYPTDQSRAGSLQYSYDLNGNRLGFVHEFGDATWNYYQGTNLLSSGTSSSEGFRKYGWDRRGNLSTETRWAGNPGTATDGWLERRQMSWNVRNELERAVVVRRGAEGYDSTVVGILYGEDGNRVLKAVVDSVSGTDTTWRVTNRWVYDGTAVVADSGASGPGWTWHAYNGLSRVAELSGGDTARVRFLLTDHLGTVQAILDDTGAVVGRYQLDPYGNLEGYQGSASTALLYTGKGFDADVGAWYFNARFYDAERGAFIGRDPKLQFWTPYSYTGNMPLTGLDPTGEVDENLIGLGEGVRRQDKLAEIEMNYARASLPDNDRSSLSVAGHSYPQAPHFLGPDYWADNPSYVSRKNEISGETNAVMSAEQLVDVLKANPEYSLAKKIVLGACFSGSNGLAQRVANITGLPVEAPRHWARINEDGSFTGLNQDRTAVEPFITVYKEVPQPYSPFEQVITP